MEKKKMTKYKYVGDFVRSPREGITLDELADRWLVNLNFDKFTSKTFGFKPEENANHKQTVDIVLKNKDKDGRNIFDVINDAVKQNYESISEALSRRGIDLTEVLIIIIYDDDYQYAGDIGDRDHINVTVFT